MNASPEILSVLAPGGRLRAAINYGNAALAQRDSDSGEGRGVSVEIARALAQRLDVECELIAFDAAGKVTDALDQDRWDVAFLAVDPTRAERLAFTHPYVRISACYMVHRDSALAQSADIDAPGMRIAVGRGAAYDLHLTRTLQHAQLERRPTAAEAYAVFEQVPLDAAAGVRRVVQRYAEGRPHIRVLTDDFLAIDQALCLPRSRADSHPAALGWLNDFVESCKRDGLVADALKRSGQVDATVAPAARG